MPIGLAKDADIQLVRLRHITKTKHEAPKILNFTADL